MDQQLIDYLVNLASKRGAQGYEVIGWVPPKTPADDPKGMLMFKWPEYQGASETPWYKK